MLHVSDDFVFYLGNAPVPTAPSPAFGSLFIASFESFVKFRRREIRSIGFVVVRLVLVGVSFEFRFVLLVFRVFGFVSIPRDRVFQRREFILPLVHLVVILLFAVVVVVVVPPLRRRRRRSLLLLLLPLLLLLLPIRRRIHDVVPGSRTRTPRIHRQRHAIQKLFDRVEGEQRVRFRRRRRNVRVRLRGPRDDVVSSSSQSSSSSATKWQKFQMIDAFRRIFQVLVVLVVVVDLTSGVGGETGGEDGGGGEGRGVVAAAAAMVVTVVDVIALHVKRRHDVK
mmetsp:Transcript_29868/g.61236  ORF Transcript_29868/g.61236 Transcript_29868/m.61236 type:complete len:281 (-) Transcript_29868:55-897(-)